jgi:endonuclease YncB( thermonuclease family)
MLMMSLTLNAQTIQGKVVRVSDGDTITILDEGKVGLWVDPNPIPPWEFRKVKKEN